METENSLPCSQEPVTRE